mmetsp:Transcript_6302/g.19898  ORF Transcript_6302/g.19898 Transcript_6302/m.19898 type:complete len:302 (+) Transcript_6302:376-1281(+)
MTTPPPKSRIALESAPSESRSKKFVGSSRMRRCGRFHIAAARTSFTFWPPERPRTLPYVPNSRGRPNSSRCAWSSDTVTLIKSRPAARDATSMSNLRTCSAWPVRSRRSFSMYRFCFSARSHHLTSYSRTPLPVSRRPMIFSNVNGSGRGGSRFGSSCACRRLSSSSFVCSSSSSMYLPKRHWRYSHGDRSRCCSMWWNECCATYAIRRLWCRQRHSPLSGPFSPTTSLISVDLPAPLAPSTQTRLASVSLHDASTSVSASRPGHVNVAVSNFRMAFVVVLMPSRRPGAGNANFVSESSRR